MAQVIPFPIPFPRYIIHGMASEVIRRVAMDQWLYIPSKECSVSSLMRIHLQANTYSLRRIEMSKLKEKENSVQDIVILICVLYVTL